MRGNTQNLAGSLFLLTPVSSLPFQMLLGYTPGPTYPSTSFNISLKSFLLELGKLISQRFFLKGFLVHLEGERNEIKMCKECKA